MLSGLIDPYHEPKGIVSFFLRISFVAWYFVAHGKSTWRAISRDSSIVDEKELLSSLRSAFRARWKSEEYVSVFPFFAFDVDVVYGESDIVFNR